MPKSEIHIVHKCASNFIIRCDSCFNSFLFYLIRLVVCFEVSISIRFNLPLFRNEFQRVQWKSALFSFSFISSKDETLHDHKINKQIKFHIWLKPANKWSCLHGAEWLLFTLFLMIQLNFDQILTRSKTFNAF